MARRQLQTGELPVRGGHRPQLVVTIDHHALKHRIGLGLLDTGIALPAETARRIGCDAHIIPAVLGAGGVPLDLGHSRRLFDPHLRRALVLRDRGCCQKRTQPRLHPPARLVRGPPPRALGRRRTHLAGQRVLLCGHHHRTIHRGEWTARTGAKGRPEFIPPAYIDPDRRPRINTSHLRM